jgi:hypothetical protein
MVATLPFPTWSRLLTTYREKETLNTHSHVVFTWALARRLRPDRPGLAWLAAAGAGLPDLPYLARAVQILRRSGWRPQRTETLRQLDYFDEPAWTPDLALHSLVTVAPVLGAPMALRSPRRREGLAAFAAGWTAHNVVDLVTHASDARPHLWPLSKRRWHSPVSYWERGAHAIPVMSAEHAVLFALARRLAIRRSSQRPGSRRRARARSDWANLAATFVAHPRQVGALAPTSQQTVDKMLDMAVLQETRLVVELGAGTGGVHR